jgi:histone deacetylase 1/2
LDDLAGLLGFICLKARSDVDHALYLFQMLVGCLFNSKILIAQLNWGEEYHHLKKLFWYKCIIHHVCSPHASPQNDIVERKHRHIVEMGICTRSFFS